MNKAPLISAIILNVLLLTKPALAAGLSIADSPLFATGVLKPNVLLTFPYEEPHNELFVRYDLASWMANQSSSILLDYYFSDFSSITGENKRTANFIRYGTYYERPGLVFPWPTSNASTCKGYEAGDAEKCEPIDVYGDGLHERVSGDLSGTGTLSSLTSDQQKLLYLLAIPEANQDTDATDSHTYTYASKVTSTTNFTCKDASNNSLVNLDCFYSADRNTRSKINLLYFQHDAYDNYTPWPNTNTYTFPNRSMSVDTSVPSKIGALHHPLLPETDENKRNLYQITGYGLTPTPSGLLEEFIFNFEPMDRNGANDTADATKMYVYSRGTSQFSWRNNYYTVSSPVQNNNFTYGEEGINYANWYTYYRSASLISKGIASRVLQGLIDRGTNERFRIGLTRSDITIPGVDTGGDYSRKTDIDKIITDPKVGTETWIKQLMDSIYNLKGPINFYNPDDLRDYAKTYFSQKKAYLEDIGSDESVSNPAYSCRRNFEILIFPDLSTVHWGRKLGNSNGIKGSLTDLMSSAVFKGSDDCADATLCPQPDGYSGTFAEMAHYAWVKDINTDLANNVLSSTRNPATWQNVVRYVVAPGGYVPSSDVNVTSTCVGEAGTLYDLFGNVCHDNDLSATGLAWPNPAKVGVGGLSQNAYTSSYFTPYMTYDDLYHMALNSRGTYSPFGSINQAVENVTEAFLDILVRNSTGSAVATNTTAIATSGIIYQAAMDGDWRGHLRAFNISISDSDSDGTNDTATVDSTPLWNSSYKISAQSTVEDSVTSYADNRRILTFYDKSAIPLRWEELDDSQREALAPESLFDTHTNYSNASGGTPAITHQEYYGKQLINYFRGNGACEQNSTCDQFTNVSGTPEDIEFRRRGLEIFSESNDSSRPPISEDEPDGRNVLGDITNSSPWYIGPTLPGLSDVDYPGYNEHRQSKSGRSGALYVGANDGMLHVIHAPDCAATATETLPACSAEDAGQELYAYVPSFILSNLPELANKGYSHKYYVDGSPFAAEAYVDGSWKTVLVSGVNKGGKGFFAVNASTPPSKLSGSSTSSSDEDAIASLILWEFHSGNSLDSTGSSDTDIGYTFNTPAINRNTGQAQQIVRTGYGPSCGKSNGNDKKNCKWAAILGNGYSEAANKKAALYVLFLDGPGGDGVWKESTKEYRKIVVGLDSYEGDEKGLGTNGLSSTTPLDVDGDGFVDYVYAGDLNGNIWKFDLTSDDPDDWEAANDGNPIFEAKDDNGNRQPIIMPPEITYNQTTGKPILLFGTGKLFVDDDEASTAVQSFYAVIDSGNTITRSKLYERTSKDVTVNDDSYRVMSNTSAFTYCTSEDPDDCTQGNENSEDDRYYGWYWDMPSSGERLTGRPQLIAGDIRFNTYIPDADPCSYGGDGWTMCLNAKSGIQSCLLDSVTLDEDDQYGGLSLLGGRKVGAALGGTSFVPNLQGSYIEISSPLGKGGNEGNVVADFIKGSGNQGRVSWYELMD